MKSIRLSSSERLRSSKGGPGRTFLLCRIQNAHFTIPVERVSEIVMPQRLTELPEVRPFVLGAFDHRGTVVPVVDFAAAIGRPESVDPKAKWVLLREGSLFVAVRVSQVLDVVWVSEGDLRPPLTDQEVSRLTTGTVVMIRGLMAFIMAVDRVMRLASP